MNLVTSKFTSKDIFVLLLIPLLISTNCERFTGYNYIGEQPTAIAQISGKVTNIFTAEPVYQAKVKVGSIITYTDENGQYIIFYKLNKDENRDKPVPIQISSPKYYSYTDSKILYPEENKLDVKLVYAAPIIEKSVLIKLKDTEYDSVEFDTTEYDSIDFDSLLICQALIFDYQGRENIKYVEAIFVYHDALANTDKKIKVEMDHVKDISENAVYYQIFHVPIASISFFFKGKYTIQAIDHSGYWDSKAGVLSESNSDTLLFTPFN